MPDSQTVPPTVPEITLHGFERPMDAQLMGVVMALASEVYVLKAEVERLTRALTDADAIDSAALDAAGKSDAVQNWMETEQKAFLEHLLRPWTEPDAAADTRDLMSGAV